MREWVPFWGKTYSQRANKCKPLTSIFKEFFGSSQLSQFMDQQIHSQKSSQEKVVSIRPGE